MDRLEASRVPELSDVTFALFQELIYREMGIRMHNGKKILVANRLRKRLLALGLGAYEEYYRLLTHAGGNREELLRFADAISTNETYFYRGENQFEALRDQVLPDLFSRRGGAGRSGRLLIWSAGSSSGEEPYTLYMVADDAARAKGWRGEITIVGTDISREMIDVARKGEYGERSLRALPQRYLERYFDPEGGGCWRVKEQVRQHVSFQPHNLLKDEPPGPRFDLIFCRNVLIYFDRPTQVMLVDERFAPVLASDGYLFIGNSESLLGGSDRFKYAKVGKSPIYRLLGSSGQGAVS